MTDPLRDRLAAALGPNYELQRLLGKGGMGSVYLARETALDRLVAVKVLPPEVTGDPETRERFRREARTAAKLTHPHIVPLYSFGEADGLLWFVMGYVAGETLAAKLERTPRPDPDLVRRVLADVADALDYAHSHGIVHRDVKPENILIEDAGGKALLADFGVARAGTGSTTLTTAGALVGTPLYMSPEQASGERELDGRSDIYSLGVVGYRMLAGRTPFESGDLRAVLAAHITQPAPELPPDAPDDLGRVVLRALAKTSVERWTSGREMREALGATDVVTADELDRLGTLPGILTGGVFMTVVIGAIWSILHFSRPIRPFWDDPVNIAIYLLVGVVPLLPISVWMNSRRMKIPLRRAVRIALWPPAGWTGIWPAAWRRPGDLWSRLPWVARRARTLLSISFLAVAALITGMILELVHHRTAGAGEPLGLTLPLAATSVIALQIWAYVTTVRYGKARGLSSEAASRLIVKPTWNDPFWKKPEISRLLEPVGPRPLPAEPATIAELAAEVRRAANALPAHHAMLAQEAVTRSEAMARRIIQMDGELAALAAEVRPEDLAAVERKVADLGPARADEPEARRAIRAMHEQQLAILRRLAGQLVDGQARREELAGMLRTLYLQVAELKIATARLNEADTSGVRAIVDRMAREVEGLKEVGG